MSSQWNNTLLWTVVMRSACSPSTLTIRVRIALKSTFFQFNLLKRKSLNKKRPELTNIFFKKIPHCKLALINVAHLDLFTWSSVLFSKVLWNLVHQKRFMLRAVVLAQLAEKSLPNQRSSVESSHRLILYSTFLLSMVEKTNVI